MPVIETVCAKAKCWAEVKAKVKVFGSGDRRVCMRHITWAMDDLAADPKHETRIRLLKHTLDNPDMD